MIEGSPPIGFPKHLLKNKFPSELYKSNVGVYGGEIINASDGKMIYKTGKFLDQVDVKGDSVLRIFDDHVIKEPLKLLLRHPKIFFNFAFNSEPMRRRGSPAEIAKNIERLGLAEFYGPHPQGIEIKKPEVFTKGIVLADIYEVDKIQAPILKDINRFQALSEATKYISNIHHEFGPIGDIVGDIIFQQKDGSKVINPVLNIPDIILTPSKRRINSLKEFYKKEKFSSQEINQKIEKIISKEQKAVDVSELMISSAFGEFKFSNDPKLVEKTIQIIAENYEDKDILRLVKSFIKRGRHTLPDSNAGGILKSFFALHNQAHLGANKENATAVRQIIVDQLEKHLNSLIEL
jgi:hypothetical protein